MVILSDTGDCSTGQQKMCQAITAIRFTTNSIQSVCCIYVALCEPESRGNAQYPHHEMHTLQGRRISQAALLTDLH